MTEDPGILETPAEMTALELKQRDMRDRNAPVPTRTQRTLKQRKHLVLIKKSVREYLDSEQFNPVAELLLLENEARSLGNLDLAVKCIAELLRYSYPKLSTAEIHSTTKSVVEIDVLHGLMRDPVLAGACEKLALALAAQKRKQLQSAPIIEVEPG
jgi:hypothetical protein